jgi:phosphatidyl-myo-inositol alpha-mannosyltransferase
MRIAITNPTTWPWVRRGAERFINELAAYLASRGHDVTVISAKPGAGETYHDRGYKTICHRRLWHPWMAKIGLLEFHMFFFTAFYSLLRGRYDAVFSLTFMDAFAAILTRRFTGAPCLFLVNGLPPKVQYFRSLTLKGAIFGAAVRRADEVIAISHYVAGYLHRRWGASSTRIPIPLDVDSFVSPQAWQKQEDLIVCAAALDDHRKGGTALFEAFALIKRRVPHARLLIAYDLPASTRSDLLTRVPEGYRKDVEFRPVTSDLPQVLGSAAITVLPSLWEAYGMLVIESFAAGTPVVATDHGALPEHFVLPGLGRLFAAGEGAEEEAAVTNAAGLAQAMEECLLLSRSPKTPENCRKFARSLGWPVLGPEYEDLIARQLRQSFDAEAARTAP